MALTRARFAALLADDEQLAWKWERVPEAEAGARRLAHPRTNLGMGRNRFYEVLRRVAPEALAGASLCDVGAYPGTLFRLLRELGAAPPPATQWLGLGLGFSEEFGEAMAGVGAELAELEFDVRRPPAGPESHILGAALEPVDVAVCTEVIEHQHQPLSLLLGIHRLVKPGGRVYLTTNSASFVGDVLKLAAARHNVESLERSHILTDHAWRPHLRLYLLPELRELLTLCGFDVQEGRYFDNGNVYRGVKGAAIASLRRAAGIAPHLRSHMLLVAVRRGDPDPLALERVRDTAAAFGLAPSELFGASVTAA